MKTIAVFLSDETTTRRLALAFRNWCTVRQFTDSERARRRIKGDDILAFVVDIRKRIDHTPAKSNAIDLIAYLHTIWPEIPVVGYVDFTPQRARDILAAAHAGAAEIILGDFDDLTSIANKIVDIGVLSNIVARVKAVLDGVVPPHLCECFVYCITKARYIVGVESLGVRFGKSRKTVSNWLALAGLPSPSRIVAWARILVAVRMLDDMTQSAEKVARELNFASGTALRMMIRRYLGCGADTLRQRGGFDYALTAFVEMLAANQRMRPASMEHIQVIKRLPLRSA